MSNNRFITTRSNFTIKERHKSLNDATIFERDYMATTNLGGYDSTTVPYENTNFKILSTNGQTRKVKHKNGNFLVNPNCEISSVDACDVWTLENLEDTTVSEESKIVIKPSSNNLLDYAYFGSCTELLKVSINDIIEKYPAELYVTDKPFIYIGNGKEITLGSNILSNPVVVDNPFNIDIMSQTLPIPNGTNEINTLRYFISSFKKYNLCDSEGVELTCLSQWTVKTKKGKTCYKNGELRATIDLTFANGKEMTIYAYNFEDRNIYITNGDNSGFHVRPNKTIVDKIFKESYNQFERLILNTDSKPKYTMSLRTPRESERGIIISVERYTWPTIANWNLDIESPLYSLYLQSLLKLTNFLDEHNSDNIWKNMTHEAIKNLDLNVNMMSKNGEDSSDYVIGIGDIHGLMLSYGRFFDDLKLSIDNIKANNNVTYDENNNLPDYFLSDTINLSGWEVSSVIDTFPSNKTVKDLFPGSEKLYDTNKLNTIFLRNLKINAKHILSAKGTRNSIEMLLGLFGMCSYDFGKNYYECLPESNKIAINGMNNKWSDLDEEKQSLFFDYKLNEYVVVASDDGEMVEIDKELPVETYNRMKNYAETESFDSSVAGLPVRIVSLTMEVEDESGTTEQKTFKYLVPWFDKKTELDGEPYFQMYGGWFKDTDGNYDETKQYLKIVSRISELIEIANDELSSGAIYYVDDISDINNYVSTSDPSNYFRLNNVNYSNVYVSEESGNGWYNIPQNDIDNDKKYGMQVVYLESIIDNAVGNNPHVGYGNYDDGETYLDYFRHLFKGAIENNYFNDEAYDCETGELLSGITNAGFTLTDNTVDNMKCWFFTDTTQKEKIYRIYEKYIDVEDQEGQVYNIPVGYEEVNYETEVNVGKKAYRNKEVFFETELETYNFENKEIGGNDEASANSIINVKKMTIEFNKFKYADNKDFKNFLKTAIYPYLKQVIPSTTIFEIINIDSDSYVTDC